MPPILAGTPLEQARAAMLLVHGRGATAQSMLPLADELELPGLAFLAPQAPGNSWYPYSFLAPLQQNEPHLSSALGVLGDLLEQIERGGIPAERVVLLGFSQGACLALEYAARNPRRYGGLVGLSGGLIGPPGTMFDYAQNNGRASSLDGTPVFLGCSDVDPHIPAARVRETDEALARLGARVTTRLYPGMGHTVNADELAAARAMIQALL